MKRPGQFAAMGQMVLSPASSSRYQIAAAKRRARDRAQGRKTTWSAGPLAYNEGIVMGVQVTAWQKQLERLGLIGQDWPQLRHSEELRRWAAKNCQRHYIPEELLVAWGLRVNEDRNPTVKEWVRHDATA